MKIPAFMQQSAAHAVTQAAGAALGINAAAAAGIILGGVYLADCRAHAPNWSEANSCYLFALPMMGISVGAKAGYSAGFNTYNPTLKRPEDK